MAILAYVVAITIQSGRLNADTQQRLQVAHSIWAGGDQILPKWQDMYAIRGKNGRACAWYGIGQSLVILPFDWLGTVVAGRLHLSSDRTGPVRFLALSYGLFPLITVLSVLAAVRLLRELGFDGREALVGGLGQLLGSTFLVYAKDHQENSLIFLVEAIGLIYLIRFSRHGRLAHLVIGTVVLGYTLAMRLPLLLDVAAISALIFYLIWRERPESDEDRRGQRLGRTAALIAASVVVYGAYLTLDRAYQYHRFGSIWTNYIQLYSERERQKDPSLPASFPFNGSFTEGFIGPFFSMGKSIFLFDPLLVAGLAAVALRRRKDRILVAWMAAFAAVLVGQAAFPARLVFWEGGHSWGARYVLNPAWMMILVGSASLYRVYRGAIRTLRALILGLAAASVAIQIASVVFYCSLEIWQKKCLNGSSFVIGQRFANLGRYFFGSPEVMDTGCDPESRLWIDYHFCPNFTLFEFRQYFSRGVFTLLSAAWFGLVVLCVVLAWCCVRPHGREDRDRNMPSNLASSP